MTSMDFAWSIRLANIKSNIRTLMGITWAIMKGQAGPYHPPGEPESSGQDHSKTNEKGPAETGPSS